MAREGKLRGMAVTRINRFCRNTKTALIIYDEFHGLGFKFIEAENPEVDYFTVEHKAAFLRKAAEAEAWSLDHANRVRDGKASVHHDGRTNAPKPTFGASRIKNGVPKWTLRAMIPLEAIEHYSKAVYSIRETADHLSVYKAQAETIYDLWREGKSNDEIAVAVGKPLRVVKVYVRYCIERPKIESAHLAEPMIFTNPQVQRWLNCPTYYGLVRHTPAPLGRRLATSAQIRRSRVRAAKFKGIVKRAVWYVIQALLAERHHAGRGVHAPSRNRVLTDKLGVCVHCGQPIVAHTRRSKGRVDRGYMCNDFYLTRQCPARTRSITELTLQEQFGQVFRRINPPDEWIRRGLATLTDDSALIEDIAQMARHFQAKRDEVGRMMAQRQISLTDAAMRMFSIDQEEADSRIRADRNPEPADPLILIKTMQNIGKVWDVAQPDERRQLVRSMCVRVFIDTIAKTISRVQFVPAATAVIRGIDGFTEVEPNIFAVAPMQAVKPRWAPLLVALRESGSATAADLAVQTSLPLDVVRYALRVWAEGGLVERAGRMPPDGQRPMTLWRARV